MIIRPDILVRNMYDRTDYVRFLVQLLPRGPGWRIPVPDERNIVLYGISSSEDFGRVTILQDDSIITPNGIPSAEVWGGVVTGRQLLMTGIPTAEVWGSPTINGLILLIGIVSSEFIPVPGILTIPGVPLQGNDFESGLGTGWDTEFTTNWTQSVDNEEGFAVRGSNGDDRLYPPSGQLLTGDLDIYWKKWLATTTGGNESTHLRLLNAVDTIITDAEWYNDNMDELTTPPASDPFDDTDVRPGAVYLRIQRISGVIWVYYWEQTIGWKRMDTWDTPKSGIVNSEDLYIQVNGADYNGIAAMQIFGTLV